MTGHNHSKSSTPVPSHPPPAASQAVDEEQYSFTSDMAESELIKKIAYQQGGSASSPVPSSMSNLVGI